MESNPSRRALLKYGSAVSSLGLVGSAVGATSGSTVDPVRLRGTREDPISRREIIQARHTYMKQWANKSGRRNSENRIIAVSTPATAESTVVAYNFELADNGTPVEFCGRIGSNKWDNGDAPEYRIYDESSQSTVHSVAEQKAEELVSEVDTSAKLPLAEEQISSSTTSNPPEWKNWAEINHGQDFITEEPGGRCLYYHSHRIAPNRPVHGFSSKVEMKPGHLYGWSGGQGFDQNATYKNTYIRTRHQWNGHRFNYDGRYPDGTEEGEVSSENVSVTLGPTPEVSVGYSYSQPSMTTEDMSLQEQEHYCEWGGDINSSSSVGKNVATYNPVSFFEITDPPEYRNRGARVVTVTHEPRWYSQGWPFYSSGAKIETSESLSYSVGSI